jgi:hypothetical protein
MRGAVAGQVRRQERQAGKFRRFPEPGEILLHAADSMQEQDQILALFP